MYSVILVTFHANLKNDTSSPHSSSIKTLLVSVCFDSNYEHGYFSYSVFIGGDPILCQLQAKETHQWIINIKGKPGKVKW